MSELEIHHGGAEDTEVKNEMCRHGENLWRLVVGRSLTMISYSHGQKKFITVWGMEIHSHRDLQELANSVYILESHFESAGFQDQAWHNQSPQLAETFAKRLILASSRDQARALRKAHPEEAQAFFSALVDLREVLERKGVRIGKASTAPLMIYAPACAAVIDEIRARSGDEPSE